MAEAADQDQGSSEEDAEAVEATAEAPSAESSEDPSAEAMEEDAPLVAATKGKRVSILVVP